MNIWTEKSIELANQRNYLDLLYKIYPMSVNLRREIDDSDIKTIKNAFDRRNSEMLLSVLLSQEIFPVKDSYVAYLKRDPSSISRNPSTVARLTGMLYEMGFDDILDKITVPKETNRQIGPLFKNWIERGSLGAELVSDKNTFLKGKDNMIFIGSDSAMKDFAHMYLGYNRNKGLDFMAKFNNIFVLAEAKFLTDFGGHQNAQFDDAVSTMKEPLDKTEYNVKVISVLDGVLYIKNNSKMYKSITNDFDDNSVIISAVLLRDYLYSL